MPTTSALRHDEIEPRVMFKLASLQMICTLCFAAGVWVCFDAFEAVSASLGGVVAIISSSYIGLRMSVMRKVARTRRVTPEESLARFYTGTVLKIVFTLMMMSILILVIKVSILPFIIAYLLAAVIVNWLALRFVNA